MGIEQYRYYTATIKFRRDQQVRPEAEPLGNTMHVFQALWPIDADEGSTNPFYYGSYAMGLEGAPISWVSSFDLVNIMPTTAPYNRTMQ